MSNHEQEEKEISSTHKWVIGLFLTVIIQSGAVFFWAATIQAQVTQNKEDITKIETKVDDINDDIRAILIGIEELKGQLNKL